jgi:peptide/nickel transport system permease protein
MKSLLNTLRELRRYPSAIIGLLVVMLLVVTAVYAMIAIPYPEAVRLWRGGEGVWDEYPRLAPPAWLNWFSSTNIPETLIMKSTAGGADRQVEVRSAETSIITLTYTFNYVYDDFPQELALFMQASYPTTTDEPSLSFATFIWRTPDGRETSLASVNLLPKTTLRFSQDTALIRKVRRFIPEGVVFPPKELEEGAALEKVLFLDPSMSTPTPLKGTYSLIVRTTTFEPGADVEATFVVYGQLYGLAGTDHYRRDLIIPLLWGAPIALAFGLLAALGTTLTTMSLAAISTWFGGIVDQVIQRITEVNMNLPVLAILIMVGTFYSRSIWLMLGLIILFNIFGAGIKNYRAIFLQVKESAYIEAARSYGAGNMRIVFRYLVPRIIPMVIPSLVTGVPGYVFLEASLAYLGLGDPSLPTWGKVINDAAQQGALYNGQYYWVIEPAVLLMLTGLGFAMVGFALDRIFNPRLRGM